MQYTRKLSDPKKFRKYNKDKKDRSDEIILLVDLAKQIAEGILFLIIMDLQKYT